MMYICIIVHIRRLSKSHPRFTRNHFKFQFDAADPNDFIHQQIDMTPAVCEGVVGIVMQVFGAIAAVHNPSRRPTRTNLRDDSRL